MAIVTDKGYCWKCKKETTHRYSLLIKCTYCGYISTIKEFVEGNEAKMK